MLSLLQFAQLCFSSYKFTHILPLFGILLNHISLKYISINNSILLCVCQLRPFPHASNHCVLPFQAKRKLLTSSILKSSFLCKTLFYCDETPSYLDGIIPMIRPANSLKFCVCKITFPGPVSFVKKRPSPPRKMFFSPFTVSIS